MTIKETTTIQPISTECDTPIKTGLTAEIKHVAQSLGKELTQEQLDSITTNILEYNSLWEMFDNEVIAEISKL